MNKTIPDMKHTTSQSTQQVTTQQLDPMQCVIIDLTKPRTKEVESRREDQFTWQVATDAQAIQMTVEAEENSPASELPLTVTEEARYDELNAVVQQHKKAFHELCLALQVIHDQRLYRQKYGSFAEYCKKELGFSRAHGYRLIDAAQVIAEMSPIGDIPKIKNVHQALALKKAKQRELQPDTAPANCHEQDAGEAKIVELENAPSQARLKPARPELPLDPTPGEPSEDPVGDDKIVSMDRPAHLATYTEMYERCCHAYNIFHDGELMKECLGAITSLRADLQAYCEWEKADQQEAA